MGYVVRLHFNFSDLNTDFEFRGNRRYYTLGGGGRGVNVKRGDKFFRSTVVDVAKQYG